MREKSDFMQTQEFLEVKLRDEANNGALSPSEPCEPPSRSIISNSKFYSTFSDSRENSESPSSRRLEPDYLDLQPNFTLDGTFGVDRIRVSLTVDPNSVAHADFLSKVYGSDGNKTRGRVRLEGQPHVYIFWPDTGNQLMTLEFNPSNFSRRDGFEICPPVLLPYYTQRVIMQVLALGDPQARPSFMAAYPYAQIGPWPSDWTSHIKVSSIHLARDFLIKDPRFSLEQLKTFKPARMAAVCLYLNSKGEIETVTHPASRGTARHQIYDKHSERKKLLASKKKEKAADKPVPEGTYRYEIQIPRLALRKIHLDTLDWFTPERILKMGRAYWDASRYHTDLVWEGQIYVDSAQTLTPRELDLCLQYVHKAQLNVPSTYTVEERRTLELQLKKAGISRHSALASQGQAYGFLNFDLGGIELIDTAS